MNNSKECKEGLLIQDTSFWMNRLRDEHQDWATNLVLFCLSEEDASRFGLANNTEKWLMYKKKNRTAS
jgi:hypothetical protein